MRELDTPRLLLMSHVRDLAKELRENDWAKHKGQFEADNPRLSESGKTFRPTTETLAAEKSKWLEANTLDSYLPKALAELERVDNLLR